MNRTVVYILSTNYAGSHYLSLLMGSHSRALHLGEVKQLRADSAPRRRGECFICRGKPECAIFHGIDPQNLPDIYSIVFSRIDPKIEVLIDISKNTTWAERYLADDRYAKKYIHLLRDPRALVRRWALTFTSRKQRFNQRLRLAKERPSLAGAALFGGKTDVYLYKWLLRNQAVSQFIADHRLDSIIVTYEDLAQDAARELTRLCEWLGLTFEPSQVDYWNFEHHGTQKKDYAQVRERHFDLRWKEFLTPAEAARVCNNRVVNEYLAGLGVRFTDDGLTIHA